MTAQGFNAGDVYSSRKKYAHIFFLPDALKHSRFLKNPRRGLQFPEQKLPGDSREVEVISRQGLLLASHAES